MEILRKHHISFKNAFSGLWWAVKTQPNFRIHFFLAAASLLLGYWLKVDSREMTILVLTIVFGLGVEMANTSIEAMTDLITSQWHKEAKIAKDVSAGMMLVVAAGAFLVGTIILLPKLWAVWVKFY